MYVRYVRNQVSVWSGDHRIGQKRLVFIRRGPYEWCQSLGQIFLPWVLKGPKSAGFYRVKVIAKL